MQKYSIIALDLDGTLTRNDKTISPRTKDTLIRAQERGLKVVLASGRPTRGMAYLADELRLKDFGGCVLAYNGGEITDWQTGECLNMVEFPNDIIPILYNKVKEEGFPIMTYLDEDIITETEGDVYMQRSSERNRMPIRIVDDFVKETQGKRIAKCMVTGEPEPLHELELRMTDSIDPRIYGIRSEAFYLEFIPKCIDKANGLKMVLDHYGLKREELIACGDGYNDQSMIKFAGLGVAMGNAKEPVKQSADYITESNEADGVANVVEKFFLL